MELVLPGSVENCSTEEGYARCARLAKTHYENFTVGSWLLPRDKRHHVYAIYAFCRFVDDLGDEFQSDRLAALDEWERDLRACYEGSPSHPYLVALRQTIQELDIPIDPFLRLIEANRMEQRLSRYRTYEDIDYYCQHSANPVGHLVLYAFGYRDEHRQRLSDYTCTALQLANFWQDVARDFAMGRLYIPQEDLERFGYSENQLARREVSGQFRSLMAYEVDRARDLFKRGMGLVDELEGRLKLDVALFSKGGMKVLDAIEAEDYDVLSKRPSLSKATKLRMMVGTTVKLKLTGNAW